MRLLRLRIDGFGSLRGEYPFDPDRVAIVVDENERGKTSLLHAIVAALYGLDRDARRYRSVISPVDRWRPWEGEGYGVELELDSDGERYTIARDFARGTVQVWNSRGQDITPEFLVEKDDILVGQQLLGLDAEEFAKCAFWRQGELADVVPDLERERRMSTLQARLESAADTRGGDASAIEAIQTLEGSLARYTSSELGTTITVDNAIKRLEGVRLALESDIRGLAHDLQSIAAPLERLAGLEEEERRLRLGIREHDTWCRKLRAEDAQRRLDRDAERRDAAKRSRAEAETLAPAAAVTPDAPTLLASCVERHDGLRRRLQTLAEERLPLERALAGLEAELGAHAGSARLTAADADALAVRAGALRRLDDEARRLDAERSGAHDVLRRHGMDPEPAAALIARFERLGAVQTELLHEQPRIALIHQSELTAAEQTRAVGRASLGEISRWKRPRYVIGSCAIVAGSAIAALAAADLAIPPAVLVGAGGLLGVAGIVTVIATALARRQGREAARRSVAGADIQLDQIGVRAAENETRLRGVAVEVGYETAALLVDDWSAVQRLRDLHAPIEPIERRLASLGRERERLVDEGRGMAGAGDGTPTPETLDAAAERIRRRLELEQRRNEAAQRLARLDEDLVSTERSLGEAERAAAQVIESANLTYEPGRPWAVWIDLVRERARQAARHRALLEQDIPALEREFLDDRTTEALRGEVDHAEAEAMALDAATLDTLAALTSPAQAETRIAALRERLDGVVAERERLRRGVQGTTDRYHADHPGRCARLEIVERELGRAVRFRDAVQLACATVDRVARETHRRWAEFLNDRVTDLLAGLGSSITRVRFGEDLDFAITLANGQQAARGRALHQLSTGARDQLHLAVRLAISRYLSRGRESLPLLIDDCFATSDDERTRTGMRLLLDHFSRDHQVILVTCHRQRLEYLASLDPELYRSRAHWLELRPLLPV